MSAQSDSEIVFSSQDLESHHPITKPFKPSEQSPKPAFNQAKRIHLKEEILPQSFHPDPTSSGKKRYRKGSDESVNDISARKADQIHKYNCEGFVRSGNKYDHLNSEEKRKERVRKEIQNLETLLNEIQLKDSIDQKIDNMRNKVNSLNSNFDSSVKVGKGLHEKYQCIKQLVAGAEFIKLAFKSNQLNKRFVSYSETLEAICWRDPKSKVPKTKQMIYLNEILSVNEKFRESKISRKFHNLSIDEECFFSIETKERTFDLIAPNVETKKIWVKTLNLLVLIAKNKGSSGAHNDNGLGIEREYEAVAKQFAGNVGNIQNEIDEIKQLCFSNEKKLKRNFLELAEEAILREAEQAARLNKAVRVLDLELQEVRDENQGLKTENISVKKHLEANSMQKKQLVAQMRSYNDEKRSIVDFIRQFQKKLLNCVEFLNLLDFEVLEKDGEQLVSTNNVAEGALLNEDFSNLDMFMNQMQVQFDTILLRTNQMQRRYSDLQERLKENATVHEVSEKDRETLTNKYNEIYALYNEAIMEKEKLSSEVNNFNGQLDNNIKENVKLKKEISELENQLSEVKKTSIAKDNDLKCMIEHARKLQNNMENQFEELRKESRENEMNKLNLLEDRYNMQIRRYENKILENERMINDLSELVKNYESQMHEYVGEIDQKQNLIEDLAASRHRLNNIIVEMEDDLKKTTEVKTPVRRSTTDTGSRCEGSTFGSPESQETEGKKKGNQKILDTQQKISIALDEKERVHSEKVAEMEANLRQHSEEIRRLQEENILYNAKVSKVKDHEEELKQKITKYQYKMKDILSEGAKVKKQFHQLELYLSHWLNLIYLQNAINCVDKTDSFSFTVFSKEVNQNILFTASNTVREAFKGISTHADFLKDILKHVENSIPNITFDIKSVELARAYRHKAKEEKAQLNHQIKEEREPFRQLSSPYSKRIDDSYNRETRHKETFKRKVHRTGEGENVNNENLPRTVKMNGGSLLREKRIY